MTRAILEELARHEGLDLGLITKGNLILRDLDVLAQIGQKNRLMVNLTITTLNVDLARILEPRAPRPDLRMETVRKLNQAGIRAGVSCAPVIPGITDSLRNLEGLVRATAEAGGKYIFANPLFLKPCSAAVFLPFLEKEFPRLAADYQKRYKDRAFLPKSYGKRISQLMARLRQKHGIRHYHRESRTVSAPARTNRNYRSSERFTTETAENAENTTSLSFRAEPNDSLCESLGAVEEPSFVGSATSAAAFSRHSSMMQF